ncbi:hypothetical protein L3V86_07060 [Thiotrichales bacterium 19S11-10]|nr:hypothetical protein [Thiotrichales bacterium 19S11-10]
MNIASLNASQTGKALYIFLLLVFIFQMTALKYIWGLEFISRAVNMLLLLIFMYFSFISLLQGAYPRRIWILYILPGVLIVLGMSINIAWNVLGDFSNLSFFGLIIPWVAYLAVPYWHDKYTSLYPVEGLWNIYYLLMFVVSVIAIIDYYLTFNGLNYTHRILTSGGYFVASLFSLYYQLPDGQLHYRMYGVFMEPGTFGMFLLPAVFYAFYYKKYLPLMIFAIAIYMINSLGVYVSLLLAIVLVLFIRGIKNWLYLIVLILLGFCSIYFVMSFTMHMLAHKQLSLGVRVDVLNNFFKYISHLMLIYPLGAPLKNNMQYLNGIYVGSTFSVFNSFITGGIFAIIGYIMCLCVTLCYAIVSLFTDATKTERMAFTSIVAIFPFVFQRSSLWDSALFAIMFAPSVFYRIQRGTISRFTDDNKQIKNEKMRLKND